ncbi:MAG: PAS domain S-box protein [Bacteroidales bacterium]|nr:PAS domain S-box protein [Bacteroidales bacterium]MBN2755780.1 PAS domain S-box protein [Bacteroidales bacterium]
MKNIEDKNILIKKLEQTKEALLLSEKKFKFLFDYSSDEIFLSDLRGNFIEVNQVACDSLEFDKQELLKMKFTDIKTPKYKQLVYHNIEKIKELGKFTYESEHVSKSGIIFPVEMKSRIINYEEKEAIISVARNISERKEMEKELLGTILKTEQKERKRFAADLHDSLSPILSTIKLYSDLLSKNDLKNTNKAEIIANIEELADLAISTAKEISNNIRPNILNDFGLAHAISEFCSYVNDTKSLNISVKTEEYKNTNRGIEETVLYQTTKELINNTLKHSEAKNVKIELKCINNQIILFYSDDGIGFDIENKLELSSGLGLNNIANKIKTIKGTCDFYSKKGKGMSILIAIKMNE